MHWFDHPELRELLRQEHEAVTACELAAAWAVPNKPQDGGAWLAALERAHDTGCAFFSREGELAAAGELDDPSGPDVRVLEDGSELHGEGLVYWNPLQVAVAVRLWMNLAWWQGDDAQRARADQLRNRAFRRARFMQARMHEI